MLFKKKKSAGAWLDLLGWPEWLPQSNGLVLWELGENGSRDMCASVMVAHGVIQASVVLHYLGECVILASLSVGADGTSQGYLIGMPGTPTETIANSIRAHVLAMGEPVLVECDLATPEVPVFMMDELHFSNMMGVPA